MFDALSTRLQRVFDKLGGHGRLTEDNIEAALREVRVALLEADVNFKVVRAFIERVKTKAVGHEVLTSLTPAHQVVKIVHDELVTLLGGSGHRLATASHPPTVIMLIGLQGSGKTTTAAKLARMYAKQGQHPLLAAADTYRPAAIDQLKTLGAQLNVPVVGDAALKPLEICKKAREEAATRGLTPLILDTAGRLHIDEVMLDEVRAIRGELKPHHILLVVDAMTGQDAVTVAERFNAAVGIDALILTKMDGDARGGAALSVKEVVGKPILFAGTGEQLDDFEPFHPDRMASRILGMGDMLTLIEKAEAAFDEEEAAKAEKKLRKGQFTLEDFLDQMQQVRKMGPLQNLVGMMPGLPKEARDAELDESQLGRIEAIIRSMTPEERRNPTVINGSRRLRIARGSGTSTQDVNGMLKQFKMVQQMMRSVAKGKMPRLPVPGR